MAGKTLYFKNTVANGALSLQDGGTAPTSGVTTTGWEVGKTATANFALMSVGSEATLFFASDRMTPAAFSAGSCWRSEQPFTGAFANGVWQLEFRLRSASAAAGQTGRVNCRLWKSVSAIGQPATELTWGVLIGSTTAVLVAGTPVSSHVTWTPGAALMFNNEYLWVQCEWEVVAASGNANADALFYVDNTTNVTTPDFAWPLAPAFYNDSAETFWASGVIGGYTLLGAIYHDDIEAEFIAFSPTVVPVTILAALMHDDGTGFAIPAITAGPVTITSHNPYQDIDEIWNATLGTDSQFPFVEFINRWTDAEYSLFRTRMRGIQFMGPGINKKFDIALVTGVLDVTDPVLPQFKIELVRQSILSQERADIIFDGIC